MPRLIDVKKYKNHDVKFFQKGGYVRLFQGLHLFQSLDSRVYAYPRVPGFSSYLLGDIAYRQDICQDLLGEKLVY